MKPELKAELIRKLETLEGITDDERAALLGLLRTNRTYGLVWEDKPEDIEETLRDQLPVLREVKDKAIIAAENREIRGGDKPLTPNHLIIEGDNLVSLSALAYTHAGKIDVIYIDPPYNTGNKDFVYNDSFVDKEDAYRHSKWLSFMDRRLRIAKKLLSDRGVIFISIDDNEQANLKLLCDEVFGEKNFVAKFDWRKKTGANDAKDIAVITESVLSYAKNHSLTIEQNVWNKDYGSRNLDRFKFFDEHYLERGRYYLDTLDRGGLQYSDSLNYGIEMPDGSMLYPNGRNGFKRDGWIWKWSLDKVKWGLENGFVVFTKTKKNKHTGYTIKYKVYEKVDNDGMPRGLVGRAYTNLILDCINQMANKEMKELFNDSCPFSNPKPVALIVYLINILRDTNSTILDFFAGSGTTLHAVMQLNAEDGGHRQCILCTNNENGICENVTYERNKRVIRGYTKPNGEKVEGLHDNNLRYYRTEFISRSRTPRNMQRLVELATDMLCIKEDLYAEQPEMGGMRVVPRVFRYFAEGERKMLIIYREEYIEEIVRLIAKVETTAPIRVYVFSPCEDPSSELFEPVAEKVEPVALPAAIYNTYKRILPKRRDRRVDTAADNAAGDPNTEPDNELGGLFETQDQT